MPCAAWSLLPTWQGTVMVRSGQKPAGPWAEHHVPADGQDCTEQRMGSCLAAAPAVTLLALAALPGRWESPAPAALRSSGGVWPAAVAWLEYVGMMHSCGAQLC